MVETSTQSSNLPTRSLGKSLSLPSNRLSSMTLNLSYLLGLWLPLSVAICLRLYTITQARGSHYIAGGKYCSTCECYIFTQQLFCECCGMRLRTNQHRGRVYKEKLWAKKKPIAVVWFVCDKSLGRQYIFWTNYSGDSTDWKGFNQ